MEADLHTHTTASDGTLTPRERVEAACDRRLAAIAITDHDTTEGIEAARQAGAALGVEVLAGVEISATLAAEEVHVLGLLLDERHPELQATLARLRDARRDRIVRMVEQLDALGYRISLERVEELARGGAMGRPHVARALEEQGYVQSVSEAFTRLIGTGGPAFVGRYKVEPAEAIDLVRAARGAPILAHPGLLANPEAVIESLIPAGLAGLEAYHSKHTPAQIRRYLDLASHRGLLVTGGSDCHGPGRNHPMLMGTVTVPYARVTALKEYQASLP